MAANDASFNWLDLAKESSLLVNPDSYKNIEILNYIKYLLWDYLYPEAAYTHGQIIELIHDIIIILLEAGRSNYIYSYDLYQKLREAEKHNNLEYYVLSQINYQDYGIERKPIDEKAMEIGYLKLKY